jgi:hypothetical protein
MQDNPSASSAKTLKRPTQERLCELFDFDPAVGVFIWRWRTDIRGGWNELCAGNVAGRLDSYGYCQISVDSQRYERSRLCWLWVTGEWPPELDHRNTVRDDDRFDNLRPADRYQNLSNRGPQRNSRSGMKGVFWLKRNRRWMAQIKARSVVHYLGLFDSKEEAAAAYAAAAAKHHGEFARTA